MSTRDTLLLSNAKFYEAFETADIEALDELWSHGLTTMCIHPGWESLKGWDAIRKSWVSIFANGETMKFSLRNVSAEVYGSVGVVSLVEEITFGGQGASQVVSANATNLFELQHGSWKIICHHASPIVAVASDDLKFRYN